MRPSRALFKQSAHRRGDGGVHEGGVCIDDAQAVRVHAERYLHVFGVVRVAEDAYFIEHLPLVEGKRPWEYVDGREVVKHFFVEDAERIFHILHQLKHFARAEDLHRRSDGHGAGVLLKTLDRFDECVRVGEGVRVETADYFAL